MAKQALQKGSSEEEVFELDKDERWHARLAEARARRAIALRDKANSEEPPKARTKPWEEDGAFEPVQPQYEQPNVSDRLDFSDRVDTLRRTLEPHETETARTESEDDNPSGDVAPPSVPEKTKAQAPGSAVARKYVERLPGDFQPAKPYVPPFVPGADARASKPNPDLDEDTLARINAATMLPEPVDESTVAAEPVVKARRERHRRGVPALLLAGVCLLAILPFSTRVMPLVKGPVAYSDAAAPGLAMVPALGITAPMAEFPRLTDAGEWMSPFVPRAFQPVALALAPLQQREVAPLPAVAAEGVGSGDLGWSTMNQPSVWLSLAAPVEPHADLQPEINLAPTSITAPPTRGESVAETKAEPGPEPIATPTVAGAPELAILPVHINGPEIVASGRVAELAALDVPAQIAEPEVLTDPAPSAAPISDAENSEFIAAAPSDLRVTIFVPSAVGENAAMEISDDIVARGHEVSRINLVDLSIRQRNLRFFHETDRAEAERLAEAYGALLRDFTSFQPRPDEGTIEIWLAGRPLQQISRSAPVQKAAPAPEPTQRIIVVKRRQSFLERLFGGHVDSGQTGSDDGDSRSVLAVRPTVPEALGITVEIGTSEFGTGAAGESTEDSPIGTAPDSSDTNGGETGSTSGTDADSGADGSDGGPTDTASSSDDGADSDASSDGGDSSTDSGNSGRGGGSKKI